MDEDTRTALREMSGQIAALEFAVQILIVAHPQRDRLARLWRSVLPEQIDKFMEQPAYVETPGPANAALARINDFIEMKLPDDCDEDDD